MDKKTARLLAACYAAIIIFTIAAVLIAGRTYKVYVRNPYNNDFAEITYTNEGIVENTGATTKNGVTCFTFKAVKNGYTEINVFIHDRDDPSNMSGSLIPAKVIGPKFIFVSGYDFGGFKYVVLGLAMLTMFTLVIFIKQFLYRKKHHFFSYKTVLDLAMALYFGLQGIIFTGIFAACCFLPQYFDAWRMYSSIGLTLSAIFYLSLPVIIVFSVFMVLSNFSLIRHEGYGKNNMFGLLISAALLIGSLICIITIHYNPGATNRTPEDIVSAIIRCIVSSVFIYLECILFSVFYCTNYAARHTPEYNKDFIIILGCKTRPDGTPLPLLRGRIDRAIEFYREQLEKSGRQACFIPSGGKGSDEIMPEAQSMKNYLVEHGIDESIIFPEDKSTTTLENMKFSKKIADGKNENANILFSTTNYHVFRSGMFASDAGMNADGVGAKTKWYFWPNAQIREFIGIIVSEWKINAGFVALTIVVSTLLANIGTIIHLFTT
ncbi:MAG: YdcF family protein [Clostridia bacterium]|nr:YdcF family protein [Clostridia bacterium]